MKRLVLFVILLSACQKPQDEDWRTYYEKSNFLETPRYDETLNYIKRLEKASPWVKLQYFSVSPLGRKNPAVIVDKDKKFSASGAHQDGKAVLLIQAGIHAGEIDGKDAGLMLIRDMVISKKFEDLLDHVVILFMPFFNVDGHERFGPYNRTNQNGPKEMGWRVTSQNLNLNRDYLKADAPEMRDWLNVFNEWLPDVLIDCHVTDGADYRHAVTYVMDFSPNVAEPVRRWSHDVFMPYLSQQITQAGFPLCPYVNLMNDNDITKGIDGSTAPPRFSTGYGAIENRPALLIETHMFKDYKTRVDGTYQMLLHSLEVMNKEYGSLIEANRTADELTKKMIGESFPISFVSDGRADTIDFQGYNFHTEKSSISGGPIVVWEKTPRDYRLPFFNSNVPKDSATVPYAYVVPKQWTAVIEALRAHHVLMERLPKVEKLHIQSYLFQNVKWAVESFEGRIGVTVDTRTTTEDRLFEEGDYVIRLNQRNARIILHLLEPRAPDSFVRWGFFNSVMEQKEYGEAYKLELLARDMIAKDPGLKEEFDEKVKTDSAFAANAYGRLNWFYMHSPYWDEQVNRYPVGKIMSEGDLK